eukprot:2738383-Prorocentrum_lima.AAC.1
MSYVEKLPDDTFPDALSFYSDGKLMRIAGVMGLHVDDYVGAIENVESFKNLEEKTYPSETGAARLQSL